MGIAFAQMDWTKLGDHLAPLRNTAIMDDAARINAFRKLDTALGGELAKADGTGRHFLRYTATTTPSKEDLEEAADELERVIAEEDVDGVRALLLQVHDAIPSANPNWRR
jgi:hypothetical protein